MRLTLMIWFFFLLYRRLNYGNVSCQSICEHDNSRRVQLFYSLFLNSDLRMQGEDLIGKWSLSITPLRVKIPIGVSTPMLYYRTLVLENFWEKLISKQTWSPHTSGNTSLWECPVIKETRDSIFPLFQPTLPSQLQELFKDFDQVLQLMHETNFDK